MPAITRVVIRDMIAPAGSVTANLQLSTYKLQEHRGLNEVSGGRKNQLLPLGPILTHRYCTHHVMRLWLNHWKRLRWEVVERDVGWGGMRDGSGGWGGGGALVTKLAAYTGWTWPVRAAVAVGVRNQSVDSAGVDSLFRVIGGWTSLPGYTHLTLFQVSAFLVTSFFA